MVQGYKVQGITSCLATCESMAAGDEYYHLCAANGYIGEILFLTHSISDPVSCSVSHFSHILNFYVQDNN